MMGTIYKLGVFAVVGCVTILVATPANADVVQRFSTAALTGGEEPFLSGEGEGYTDNWDDGIEGEDAYAGSDGTIKSATVKVVSGGVTEGEGDYAASFTMMVDNATTTYWYGGVMFDGGKLSVPDLTQMRLSVSIKAPRGKEFQLRIESSSGNFLAFNGVGNVDGGYQTIGGLLADADEVSGMFNPNANVKIVVAFRHEQDNWQSGGSLIIDDIMLEPASGF